MAVLVGGLGLGVIVSLGGLGLMVVAVGVRVGPGTRVPGSRDGVAAMGGETELVGVTVWMIEAVVAVCVGSIKPGVGVSRRGDRVAITVGEAELVGVMISVTWAMAVGAVAGSSLSRPAVKEAMAMTTSKPLRMSRRFLRRLLASYSQFR